MTDEITPAAVIEANDKLVAAEKAEDIPSTILALRNLANVIRLHQRNRLLEAVNFEARARVLEESLEASSLADSDAMKEIGAFAIEKMIGRGAGSIVYQAVGRTDGIRVAVKVLDRTANLDPSSLERFEREATILAALRHPHIVAARTCGFTDDSLPYIVMDLVNGSTLKEIVQRSGKLSESKCIDIATQLCRALSVAHKQGIVHRDLKPANVMVDDANVVKLLDFGIARQQVGTGGTVTNTGVLIGTPAYMSPEQCLGHPVDHRSDIYSFGCLLFFMLTGCEAFEAGTQVETIMHHLMDDLTKVRSKLTESNVSAPMQCVIAKALSMSAENRYSNVEEMEHDLSSVALGKRPQFANSAVFSIDRRAPWIALTAVFLLAVAFSVASKQPQWGNPESSIEFTGSAPGLRTSNKALVQILNKDGRVIFSDSTTSRLVIAIGHAAEKQISLQNANLSGKDLTGLRATGVDLRDADLTKSMLIGAHLYDAKLDNALLSGAHLTQCRLVGASLVNAQLNSARLGQTEARSAILSGADLSNAVIVQCDMQNALCTGTIFSSAQLSQTKFNDAKFHRADFKDADIGQCEFERADFQGADFTNAKLSQNPASTADLSETTGGTISIKDGYLTSSSY